MAKKLYIMKDHSITIMAKTKYEALYKASVAKGRVVDWSEMEMRTAYLPARISGALTILNPKGIYMPIE